MTTDRHVVSLSGGKDSVAACLHLRELGIEHERIFMDTGWEHPDLYAHLEYLEGILGPVIRLDGLIPIAPAWAAEAAELEGMLGHPSAFVRWHLKKGMFSSRMRRFCTQELKVRPFLRWADEQGDIINVVGIRAAESEARSKLPEREPMPGPKPGTIHDGIEVWRPLIRWSEADVIAIHARHGVLPCPLYLRGARRVGCWPCIMASKDELRLLAQDEARVAVMRRLEELVGLRAAERGAPPPAFFQSKEDPRRVVGGVRQAAAPGAFACWPIDKVLAWAKTTHGGRQFELFAASSTDAGCMRWGMCDVAEESES